VTGNERRCAHGRRCGVDGCGAGHARDFPAACGEHCPICEERVRQTRRESARPLRPRLNGRAGSGKFR
jgi:hypothetical protein